MAAYGILPNYQRVVTGHNDKGEAIFENVDSAAPWQTGIDPSGSAFSLAWTTNQYPVDMTAEKDVKTYQEFLQKPPGIVQNSGTVLRVVVSVLPGIGLQRCPPVNNR